VQQVIDQLLAGGHLGLFAAFLVWNYTAIKTRLDTLVTSFQTQLKDITDDYDDRILKMRERYDLVIREAREERADDARDFMAVRAKIHEQITARLEAINTKLDQLMARQR
jgi:hypothetical protein